MLGAHPLPGDPCAPPTKSDHLDIKPSNFTRAQSIAKFIGTLPNAETAPKRDGGNFWKSPLLTRPKNVGYGTQA